MTRIDDTFAQLRADGKKAFATWRRPRVALICRD